MRVTVGASEKVVIGRSNPSPQSARCDPSDAIVEFAFVVLKLPKVKSGRYLYPFISCTACAEKPSFAGSNSDAGSRYSPNFVMLARRSTRSFDERVDVNPALSPVFV